MSPHRPDRRREEHEHGGVGTDERDDLATDDGADKIPDDGAEQGREHPGDADPDEDSGGVADGAAAAAPDEDGSAPPGEPDRVPEEGDPGHGRTDLRAGSDLPGVLNRRDAQYGGSGLGYTDDEFGSGGAAPSAADAPRESPDSLWSRPLDDHAQPGAVEVTDPKADPTAVAAGPTAPIGPAAPPAPAAAPPEPFHWRSAPEPPLVRPAPRLPRPAAAAGVAGTAGTGPAGPPRRRRARLQLRRLDPWSTLKFSLVLSLAFFVIWMVAIGVLYGVLDQINVFDKLNHTINEINNSASNLITPKVVFGAAAVIGAIYIVLFTALATIGSFIYNLCADMVGGIEVTLTDGD